MKGKVSVIVVSGFVGAGKTTVLRRLVSELNPARTAVITNDLSGLTGEIESFGGEHYLRGEALVELTAECTRCSLRQHVAEAIVRLSGFGRYDTILIENSGSTDPLLIANLFETDETEEVAVSAVARLDHLVTVVDAERFWEDYESGATLRERGLGTGPDDARTLAELLADQLECSTTLVLNKCDRVTPAERQRLERFLWQVNPDAGYLAVSRGDLDPLFLETTRAHGDASQEITPGWMHLLSSTSLSEDEHDTETFVYRAKRPFHPLRFWLLMQEEWPGVLRSKGYFWVASQPKTCYMWSQAGANCLYERLGRWWVAIPDRHWPKGEGALDELRKVWDLEFGDRRIELAFIGEEIDRVDLKRRLDACLLTRAELALDEELWRAFRDPFKKPTWEKRHMRSERHDLLPEEEG
ncbi:MAG: GTP-binding protein [Nitrospira sp.]|nr:GTP-binding protein [Nitrospira sp.]